MRALSGTAGCRGEPGAARDRGDRSLVRPLSRSRRPIEETVGAMAELVEAGLVDDLVLSNVTAMSRACHAVDSIAAAAERVLAVDANSGASGPWCWPGSSGSASFLGTAGGRELVGRVELGGEIVIRRDGPRFQGETLSQTSIASDLREASPPSSPSRRRSWRWPGCCIRATTLSDPGHSGTAAPGRDIAASRSSLAGADQRFDALAPADLVGARPSSDEPSRASRRRTIGLA